MTWQKFEKEILAVADLHLPNGVYKYLGKKKIKVSLGTKMIEGKDHPILMIELINPVPLEEAQAL